MLFAVVGSQGSGKSTILRELANRGYDTVIHKTSRSVLKDWNITLDQVYNDLDLCVRFHNELLERKLFYEFSEDQETLYSDTVFFTERTFADLFTYALITVGRSNKYDKWLNEYYDQCKQACTNYTGVFYLPPGKFKIENDGVRGINKHYGLLVDKTLKRYTRKLCHDFYKIESVNVDQRVDFIIQTSNNILLRYQK